jgi:hypothetical protein
MVVIQATRLGPDRYALLVLLASNDRGIYSPEVPFRREGYIFEASQDSDKWLIETTQRFLRTQRSRPLSSGLHTPP